MPSKRQKVETSAIFKAWYLTALYTVMLTDRSMLPSERLHTSPDSDRYIHPRPNSEWSFRTHEKIGGRITGPKGIGTPQKEQWSQVPITRVVI